MGCIQCIQSIPPHSRLFRINLNGTKTRKCIEFTVSHRNFPTFIGKLAWIWNNSTVWHFLLSIHCLLGKSFPCKIMEYSKNIQRYPKISKEIERNWTFLAAENLSWNNFFIRIIIYLQVYGKSLIFFFEKIVEDFFVLGMNFLEGIGRLKVLVCMKLFHSSGFRRLRSLSSL